LSHSLSPPPPARRTKPRHTPLRAHHEKGLDPVSSSSTHAYYTHISKADHPPDPPQGLPHNAARLRSTKSDSPFERTCPTPALRPAPGNLLREGSTEQALARSRCHFGKHASL